MSDPICETCGATPSDRTIWREKGHWRCEPHLDESRAERRERFRRTLTREQMQQRIEDETEAMKQWPAIQ